eukprot:1026744-Rhodomonas_salina.1
MPGPSRPSTASSWLQSASGESLSASALSAGSSRPGAAASVQHHLRIRGAKQGRSVQERGGDASVSGEGGGLGFSEAEEYERVPAGMGGQGKHVPFLSRLAGPKVAESPRRDDVQPGYLQYCSEVRYAISCPDPAHGTVRPAATAAARVPWSELEGIEGTENTLRNQTQETTFPVQSVPGTGLNLIEFAV